MRSEWLRYSKLSAKAGSVSSRMVWTTDSLGAKPSSCLGDVEGRLEEQEELGAGHHLEPVPNCWKHEEQFEDDGHGW